MTIMEKVRAHYIESCCYFFEPQIVGIFLQGSQNYGLDTPSSDVDTKLIVVPTFREIAMNKKPVSHTHILPNEEHIDFKDVRLYMQTFRKQNLNFLEILFTPYFIVNPIYKKQWNRLIETREDIAHMNPYRSVKSMVGVALEKYHAMEHEYPSKVEIIRKYGYDGKQLHHLVRVEEYLERYINGEPYVNCLISRQPEFLKDIKLQKYSLVDAREMANKSLAHIRCMEDDFCLTHKNEENEETVRLLNDVQYEIMRIAVKGELQHY